MLSYERIRKELRKQKEIEGNTPETALLLRILELHLVKNSIAWRELTSVTWYRYGSQSYQSYRFYYPSRLLINLQDFFEGKHDELPDMLDINLEG